MGSLIQVKFEGLRELKASLSGYINTIQKDVDNTLMDAVSMIGMTAKSNCAVQSIAQTIQYGKTGDKYTVSTEDETSVYLEFGTGNYAKTLLGNYPKDWKDMAMKFYINGLGRSPSMPYLYPAYQQYAGEAVLKIVDKIEGH